MIPRERVLKALRRDIPDKVPRMMRFCPALLEEFKKRTGFDNPAEYYQFEIKDLESPVPDKIPDFFQYLGKLPENATVDEWGVGWIPGSMYHFAKMVHPLRNLSTVKELEKYPFPNPEEHWRYDGLKEKIEAIHDRGFAVRGFYPGVAGTLFETAWKMRGMEKLLLDFYLNPEFAEYLIEKITVIHCISMNEQAKAGVDVIRMSDDVGMQNSMLMSPDLWRKWFKRGIARIIESAKKGKPDILSWFHSDGYCEPIIPDLIEINVDILNPIQPECMDPAKLKKEYGDRLAFWGTIGTQTTMPFATPEEVKETIRLRIQTVGYNGGLLLEPTHILEPEVPWQNIEAFLEAVDEFHY